MKLTKENVYVNLQGKTKEELTDLWEFLTSNGEKLHRDLDGFLTYSKHYKPICHLSFNICNDEFSWNNNKLNDKTEVTIDQLKEIIKPMGTFTPIAMKCDKKQFKAIKPKLKEIGKIGDLLFAFENDNLYLVNNYNGQELFFDISYCDGWNRTVHEEWKEEIFLKACGIEVETLQQQLQKAESEVKRLQSLIEEENNIKLGDWVYVEITKCFFKISDRYINYLNNTHKKITNPQLIELLEQEIK